MKAITYISLLIAALLATLSCDDEDKVELLTEWQGAEPHLTIKGSLDGEDLDIGITGAEAGEITKLMCEREYDVDFIDGTTDLDYENGKFSEIEIFVFTINVNGEMRDLQIEFKDHDFGAASVGDVIKVVPKSEEEDPGPTELFVDWEWYKAGDLASDGDSYYEQSAVSGTVRLELLSGDVGSDGLMIPDNEGAVGFFADLTWSETERVTVSVTANCGPNDL